MIIIRNCKHDVNVAPQNRVTQKENSLSASVKCLITGERTVCALISFSCEEYARNLNLCSEVPKLRAEMKRNTSLFKYAAENFIVLK